MQKCIIKSLKIFALVISTFIAFIGGAHAYDVAKMQMEIVGAAKNKFYLCVSNVGCVRIDSNKQIIPINPMDIRYIFLANTSTYEMYPQTLPNSCNVTVNSNQKLVVKGNLSKAANDKVYLANLHCAVI